jgi:hypothetical protein
VTAQTGRPDDRLQMLLMFEQIGRDMELDLSIVRDTGF